MIKYILALILAVAGCYLLFGWPAHPFVEHVNAHMRSMTEIISTCDPKTNPCLERVQTLRQAWIQTRPTQRGRVLHSQVLICTDILIKIYSDFDNVESRRKLASELALCYETVKRERDKYKSQMAGAS